MIRVLLASVLFAALGAVAAPFADLPSRATPYREQAPVVWRAPELAATQSIVLALGVEKSAATVDARGRLRVGTVRALSKAQGVDRWSVAAGGFASRLDAASTGALGLRTKLDISALRLPLEVRVQGADGRIELMTLEPGQAAEAWTPWTEGEAQAIELFSAAPQDVKVAGVLHFTASPYEKAAASCTVPVSCTTNDSALDAAIAAAKKAVMRINFVEDGGGYVCTATLVNTERFPSAYILTANHCVSSADVANTITSLWFYETNSCTNSTVNAGQSQVGGGMQLVFTDYNVDSTLLLMSRTPPAGAVYAGMSASRIASTGATVTSISHPEGDTARLALGTTSEEIGIIGRDIFAMQGVRFTRGIIQGGSSGSGLFTMSGGNLQLRGVLSGATVRHGGLSCTNLDEDALYGFFDIFRAEIDPFIRSASVAADDAPNRIQDMPAADPNEVALNLRTSPVALDARRIDYPGDVDFYRFTLSAPATVSAWTEGANIDTIGNIVDPAGNNLEANDDAQYNAQNPNNHFGITARLAAGTYYLRVAHFEPTGTGPYNLRLRADTTDSVNHTALWWNANEPGWGLNVNHQGNTVFATLFTYDSSGPMWLVMSEGARQADGSYSGALYRTTGPAFNTTPFTGVAVATVGTMSVSFSGSDNATLTYTFNGTTVTKNLTRQAFGTVATCHWSAFDRTFARNYQDLWYNANETGWGLNVTHQGSKIFATLFTYDATGRGIWLVMSEGAFNSTTGAYSGPLYRTSGPVFNASPWTAATATQVGTMSFTPSTGNAAVLAYSFNGVSVTKSIQRQTFASLRPECE